MPRQAAGQTPRSGSTTDAWVGVYVNVFDVCDVGFRTPRQSPAGDVGCGLPKDAKDRPSFIRGSPRIYCGEDLSSDPGSPAVVTRQC